MLLATVVSIFSPALLFIVTAVAFGLLLARVWRNTLASSLISSAVVSLAWVVFRGFLPRDFSHYAQDMIYEPLVRDAFQPVGETIASALFHFAVPLVLLALVARMRARQDGESA